MTTFRTALFDLDGTIIDSAPGIAATFAYTLARFGVVRGEDQMREFMGPPLGDSFSRLVAPEHVDACVRMYRERYAEDGIYRCSVFPGVPELLRKLKADGWTVCLATSKLRAAAVQILDRFELSQYFDYIAGSNEDGTIEAKADVIRDVLAQPGIEKETAVMIGDRRHDAEGAAECGLPVICVLYGYGDREELSACAPLALCQTAEELYQCLSRLLKR